MILTCPSCGTQYVVKDGAIPPGGRQVRCASCKHSWHQDPEFAAEDAEPESMSELEQSPPEMAQDVPEMAQDAEERAEEDESLAEATLIEPRSGPEAEERAYEEAIVEAEPEGVPAAVEPDEPRSAPSVAEMLAADPVETQPASSDWSEPPLAEAQEDEFSPFPATDDVELRRRSPIVAILLIAIVVAALAAAFWFLAPPEWKAALGLGAGSSPLALVTTHMDRQRLESGNELLTVTGRVINPTSEDQDVPPLQAQLRARGGKVVYSWTIAPPARTLAPGASASFNSAEVNVPPGGEELTITVGSPKA
jgi:predicted Zn finger-like uncharacterized protein